MYPNSKVFLCATVQIMTQACTVWEFNVCAMGRDVQIAVRRCVHVLSSAECFEVLLVIDQS